MKKKVELLSPQARPKQERVKKNEKEKDDKNPKSDYAVLKVALHCYGCLHLGNLKKFHFRELQVATYDFSSKNLIGKGDFGNVYNGYVYLCLFDTEIEAARYLLCLRYSYNGNCVCIKIAEILFFI